MVEVMLPLTLLVAAGALWPRFFADAQVAVMRTQLNRLVSMMTVLLLADRFRLDAPATALLIGWSTIGFWLTLPILMALGLVTA